MSQCRSCNAEIVWARTERGKRMPLDADPVADAIAETRGLFVLREVDHADGPLAVAAWGLEGTEAHYRSHFASCPQAALHRKREELSRELQARQELRRIGRRSA